MDGLTGQGGGNLSPNDDSEAARRAARTRLGHTLKRDPRREETEAWKPNRTYKNGEESCPTGPTALIQCKIVKYNDP